MRIELLVAVSATLALGACNAVDRAAIVCSDSSFASSDALLMDCQAGAQIADETAVNYAKSHRLLPMAWVPDNDELRGAKSDAYAKCVVRTRTPADPQLETQRQLACEAGIEAYIRQIQYLNHGVGQSY